MMRPYVSPSKVDETARADDSNYTVHMHRNNIGIYNVTRRNTQHHKMYDTTLQDARHIIAGTSDKL